MTRFQKLAVATTLVTFVLVLSGSTVRITGSGDGCGPDWPNCNGQWIPDFTHKEVVIEYTHRLTALSVSFLVLGVAIAALRGHRRNRAVTVPALLAVVFLIAQVLLGAATVKLGLPPEVVAAHLATSMALFASELFVVAGAFLTGPRRKTPLPPVSEGMFMLAASTAAAVYALLLTGAFVTGTSAGPWKNASSEFICKGWPLCNGEVFPTGSRLIGIAAFHRLMTAAVSVLVAVLIWRILTRYRRHRALRFAGLAIGLSFIAQVFIGAGNVWLEMAEAVRVVHLGAAALVWGAVVVTAAVVYYSSRGAGVIERTASHADHDASRPLSTKESVAAYINLTKPRIIELLLVTTVPAMVLAERGMPHPLLILGTLIGGTLTAGGANAINCYIDRDIDQVMKRTSHRSLARGRIAPDRALAFGIAIGVIGFLELAVLINILSAVLAVSAILFYVFVYTLWLKRNTVQNIVIGGAAGAVPPLVGWAAVTGRVDLPALVLFGIIFLWTPPHFWALALKYRGDYAAANVPMLPVARGEEETRRQIFVYSLLLVGFSLLLYVTGGAGVVYLVVALLMGAALIRMALQLLRTREAFPVMRLFTYSITYLAALFGAMIVDQAARSFWL